MPSEDGRQTAVAAWGAPGPSTGTFYVQPYLTTATIPQKRKPEVQDPTSESIDCICGFTYDDGSLSIACDDCERWCHAACFDIVEGEVPEEWRCWECLPRQVDKERAVRIQRERQRQIQGMVRRNSPGVEKKPRRASAAAIEGSGRRRRRPSILTQTHTNAQTQQRTEEEHVEICDPWTLSYVPITKDIVPHRQTQEKLERAAHSWRGVTALQVSEQDLHPPRTTVQPLPVSSFSHPTLSLCTNPSVRPPSYAVHTAEPVPRSRMITPYHSTIIPSSVYLSDTLNAYAHLGMPKPFVHLIGPPLDLALDSRITGDTSRFLRSGCKPNAVLRPMICPKSTKKNNDLNGTEEQMDEQQQQQHQQQQQQQQDTLKFGVFALRDLKANEEVVLGWEWDDGHAVHNLPALIESPHAFKCVH
jgi:PHD-finger